MAYDIFGNDIGDVPINNSREYGKLGPQQIEQRIGKQISENQQYLKPLYGSGAPLVPPRFIGDNYYDTTNKIVYSAYGLELSDWTSPTINTSNGSFESGTVTITAGGGDVTVTLTDIVDWTGGWLTVVQSLTAANYFDLSGGALNTCQWQSTYDALTNASYTNYEVYYLNSDNNNSSIASTANFSGVPKSATTNSFTLNDDGANTVYVKWFIMA